MKGVVLAGGLGTRLRPLSLATNKHLLPIYDQPMVFYPIQTLVKAGITEVIIVTGGPHAGHFLPVLKNGDNLGLTHLEYAYQEGEGGIPAAVALAEKFAAGDSICVILGDNTTDADISSAVRNFNGGSIAFLKEVPDPERYGVPVFDGKDKTKIIRIEEKPKHPKSKYASTGLYIFDNKCFNFIRNCKPSARGELEIPDVQNQYIDRGELRWEMLDGFWTDAGKFETLFAANAYWAKKKGIV
ncbi:NTP transferase domain-containing protein [Candidatus Collierbacteria bacterium]|nr:NTP transferase domain-containing protein [Candidatus Collierbacteria bacterium]